MKQLALPGAFRNGRLTVESEQVDYSAGDGTIAVAPSWQAVYNAPIRGATVWRDKLYFATDTALLSYDGATVSNLASLPAGGSRVYFVPLADTLVLCKNQAIYLWNGTTLRQFQRPAPFTNTPNTERVLYAFSLNAKVRGNASVSFQTETYTVEDTANNEPGDWAEFSLNLPTPRPTTISGIVGELLSWQNTISLPLESNLIAWDAANDREIARQTLYYPYQVGQYTLDFYAPFQISDLRIRNHVRHRQVWKRQYYAKSIHSPRFYALTRVVDGVESEPLFFEVSANGGLQDFYFVKLTGLPNTTYRLYRSDSAGYYRLVHEGNDTTFVDYKTDAELGERLVLQSPPAQASLAILHDRRAVIAHGNELYLSEHGSFAWGTGAERLVFHDRIIGLASIAGTLYLCFPQGWAILVGDTGGWNLSPVFAPPCPEGYVSYFALLVEGRGLVRSQQVLAQDLLPYTAGQVYTDADGYPVATVSGTGEEVVVLSDGQVYLGVVRDGRLFYTQLSFSGIRDGLVYRGHIYLFGTSGLWRRGSTRDTARIRFTIPLENPANLYTVRVIGEGEYTLKIHGRRGVRAINSANGLIPTVPRVEHDNFALTLELELQGNAKVERLLLEAEARTQKTREAV